jgi:hypothetical protein
MQDGFELAWAAGVFDATGSATWSTGPMLNLKQSTETGSPSEMVLRFHDATQRIGRLGGPYREHSPNKVANRPFAMWYARADAAQRVMELLGPWLSAEKRAQWDRVRAADRSIS